MRKNNHFLLPKKIPALWIRRRISFEETPLPKTEVVTPVYKLTTSSDWSLMNSTKNNRCLFIVYLADSFNGTACMYKVFIAH